LSLLTVPAFEHHSQSHERVTTCLIAPKQSFFDPAGAAISAILLGLVNHDGALSGCRSQLCPHATEAFLIYLVPSVTDSKKVRRLTGAPDISLQA
jgi:hypothetical protein